MPKKAALHIDLSSPLLLPSKFWVSLTANKNRALILGELIQNLIGYKLRMRIQLPE